MFDDIYAIGTLDELERYLLDSSVDIDNFREELFGEFLKYADYSTVSEWNRAVRICECLAVIGWGNHEPVEALVGTYVNGASNTYFLTAAGDARFVNAVWSKRINGLVIDAHRTGFYASPDDPMSRETVLYGYGSACEVEDAGLMSQRNWISKNPVWITRTLDNCYPGSRAVIDSIDRELQPMLDNCMRPELYGRAVSRIIINCAYSFYDDFHCKTNYIIADDGLRLKQDELYGELLTMFTSEEIERQGLYLRKRFDIGPFRRDTGKVRVNIVFEKEFSDRPHYEQKQIMSRYFVQALERIASRVSSKIRYDFTLMISDFRRILDDWLLLPQ